MKIDMKERHEFDGIVATADKLCELLNIPQNVYEWRYNKNYRGKRLFAKVDLVYFKGDEISLEMLSERVKISLKLLRERYEEGARGDALITPEVPDINTLEREKKKEDCRKHLLALFHAHPEKRQEAYLIVQKKVMHPFDEAQALLNAKRLKSAATDREFYGGHKQWLV